MHHLWVRLPGGRGGRCWRGRRGRWRSRVGRSSRRSARSPHGMYIVLTLRIELRRALSALAQAGRLIRPARGAPLPIAPRATTNHIRRAARAVPVQKHLHLREQAARLLPLRVVGAISRPALAFDAAGRTPRAGPLEVRAHRPPLVAYHLDVLHAGERAQAGRHLVVEARTIKRANAPKKELDALDAPRPAAAATRAVSGRRRSGRRRCRARSLRRRRIGPRTCLLRWQRLQRRQLL